MWKIEYTKRFLKELSKLPKEIQIQAEKIVFVNLSTDCASQRYLQNIPIIKSHNQSIPLGKMCEFSFFHRFALFLGKLR
jgi:mRNA-degrading endonuclease RelE of RelBE toxin-antitoxin system